METTLLEVTHQLNACLSGRQQAADELQNEINQILASALLWIRFAKTENQLSADQSVCNAELNLNEAIERIRALHYALMQEKDW